MSDSDQKSLTFEAKGVDRRDRDDETHRKASVGIAVATDNAFDILPVPRTEHIRMLGCRLLGSPDVISGDVFIVLILEYELCE